MRFAPVFVSYHQFQVRADGESGDHLDLYTVGDDLLQVTGRSHVTVLTGPHTGEVQVNAEVVPSAPDEDPDGWNAAAEATVWCPTGQVSVCGLMGECPDKLAGLSTGRPGLLRVRVLARGRRPEDQPPNPHAPEQYWVRVWPIDTDTGFRSLHTDGLRPAGWTPKPAHAAAWAMVRLVNLANPDPREAVLRQAAQRHGHLRPQPAVDRVRVHRHRTVPAAAVQDFLNRPADHLGAVLDGTDLVLPAGDVDIRLHLADAGDRLVGRWRWTPRPASSTAVPDPADSDIDIQVTTGPDDPSAELTVVHSGVRALDAVLLGLVWDHLLAHVSQVADGSSPTPHPWQAVFAAQAAQAAAHDAANRRAAALAETRRWGGTAPTPRLRQLPANSLGLALLDRPLLDALADAPAPTQRALARWAARQACAIAGLDTIDWIAAGLTALEHNQPLPAPFDDPNQTSQRLWADQRVPHTTVTIPTGTPNCSQQAIALPAIPAAAHTDPLAAAVDTIYFAALAHGDQHRTLLTAAGQHLAAHQTRKQPRPPQ